jgi:hypothetical protein
MNTLIQSIIDQQISNYQIYTDSNIDFLGEEDVFLIRTENEIKVISNEALSQGATIRLEILMPYVGQALYKYSPIGSGIIICLGDITKSIYKKSFPVLCFSKNRNYNGILIPNIDFFTKTLHRDLFTATQDISFYQKKDSSIFIGASTGEFNNNIRVKYGLACRNKEQHSSYLSSLCQHSEENWISEYPKINTLLHPTIAISEQLQNKIVVNIDGNTVCWSRLYWQMMSNSIPVYIEESMTQIQFFDSIEKTDCYMATSLDNVFDTYEYIFDTNNHTQILSIIENGKKYCNNLFMEYLNNPDSFLHSVLDNIIYQFYSLKSNTQCI